MKLLSLMLLTYTFLIADFNIKDIYIVNYDIIVDIDQIDGEINEDVEKEICELESVKSVRGDIYIKYQMDNINKVKKIEVEKCF